MSKIFSVAIMIVVSTTTRVAADHRDLDRAEQPEAGRAVDPRGLDDLVGNRP